MKNEENKKISKQNQNLQNIIDSNIKTIIDLQKKIIWLKLKKIEK